MLFKLQKETKKEMSKKILNSSKNKRVTMMIHQMI